MQQQLARSSAPSPASPVASARPSPLDAAAKADPRLAEARAALEQRQDYAAAFQLVNEAEKQGAPVSAVEAVRAAVFRETEYLDREIESYQRWAAAAPDDAEPYLRLYYIYADLAWKREADNASREALKRAPREPRAHIARAVFLEEDKQLDAALAALAEAERLNGADPATIHNIRATFFVRAEKGREAEAEARKAITREPTQLTHRMVLAQALLKQDRLEEAAAEFRAIQEQEPDNVEAIFQLGVIAEKQGDLPEATRLMERAAEINAQYGTVLWTLMQLYRRQGRVEDSKPIAKLYGAMKRSTSQFGNKMALLQSRPGDLKLHWQVAQSYMAMGNYPKAIAELRAIQHFQPKDALILQALHISLTKAGRVTEAEAVKKTMQEEAARKKNKKNKKQQPQ